MSKFNQDSMDALFGGLVGESAKTEQEEKKQSTAPVSTPNATKETTSRRGRPSGVKKESVCTVVDVDLMNKVRAIAKKEDLSITTIFEVGLKMAVQSYEAKNGPIRVRQSKKKDVGDVFGLE